MSQVIAKDNTSIGTNTVSDASTQLAKQMAVAFAQMAKVQGGDDKVLIQTSLALVLGALENGKISVEMSREYPSVGLATAEDWKARLLAANVATDSKGFAPLIIHDDRLFLARYFLYERQLQSQLSRMSSETPPQDNQEQVLATLNRLFPASDQSPNWQKVAAALALDKRLCIISGGPGTGKTTTVLRLLAALCTNNADLRIKLAAPTGKAAARMQESIRLQMQDLDCDDAIKQQLDVPASTLHRLLGYVHQSVKFRHQADNPLALDVLVIDEASMIDTALMAKCLEALPAHARLILLGDKDQLAAVDPGSPFADMCREQGFSQAFADRLHTLSEETVTASVVAIPKPLGNNVVVLQHSYRFGVDSGIGKLATAVNQGKQDNAWALLEGGQFADIAWQDYQPSDYRKARGQSHGQAQDPLQLRIQAGFKNYMAALQQKTSIKDIFTQFSQFCVLAAVHKGFSGRIDTNALCEEALFGHKQKAHWFHGRPIIVSKNNYQTNLYNGDVGLCLDMQGDGNLRVYFPTTDGFKDFTPSRVPEHETAFAITVHKSQGSEFENVLLLLPDVKSKILTKSLVYTAITRAKSHVEIWGKKAVFLGVESE